MPDYRVSKQFSAAHSGRYMQQAMWKNIDLHVGQSYLQLLKLYITCWYLNERSFHEEFESMIIILIPMSSKGLTWSYVLFLHLCASFTFPLIDLASRVVLFPYIYPCILSPLLFGSNVARQLLPGIRAVLLYIFSIYLLFCHCKKSKTLRTAVGLYFPK